VDSEGGVRKNRNPKYVALILTIVNSFNEFKGKYLAKLLLSNTLPPKSNFWMPFKLFMVFKPSSVIWRHRLKLKSVSLKSFRVMMLTDVLPTLFRSTRCKWLSFEQFLAILIIP